MTQLEKYVEEEPDVTSHNDAFHDNGRKWHGARAARRFSFNIVFFYATDGKKHKFRVEISKLLFPNLRVQPQRENSKGRK